MNTSHPALASGQDKVQKCEFDKIVEEIIVWHFENDEFVANGGYFRKQRNASNNATVELRKQ